MSDVHPTFSLVRDPWISCSMLDGSLTELSLWDIFERRSEVRRLAGELPTQDYAVLRLLLAILYRAIPVFKRENMVSIWQQYSSEPETLWAVASHYLQAVEDSFQLFDGEEPFMQVADLSTQSEKYDGVSRLIADVPSGHQYFTTRAGRGLDSLSFAEAARWLIHVNAFDFSGIKSGAIGDVRVKGGKGYPIGTGWVGSTGGVYFEGSNLGETLLLNLDLQTASSQQGSEDIPVWERPPLGPGEERSGQKPGGPSDALTWPSRRVRLFPRDGRVVEVMVSNGDKLAPQNMLADAYTAYRYSKPQSAKFKEATYMPKEHDAERTLWRGISSLLIQGTSSATDENGIVQLLPPKVTEWVALLANNRVLDPQAVLNARLVGMIYGTQSSVVSEIIDESLPMHLSLLASASAEVSEAVKTAVAETDHAIWALGSFAGELSVAAGGDPEPPREGIRQRAFFAVEEPFRAWVLGLRGEEEPEAVREAWNLKARQILQELIAAEVSFASTAAVIGRYVDGRLISAATAENRIAYKLRLHLPLKAEIEGARARALADANSTSKGV
ncbi:type I-E CRISPR-associated protein Cse1/CasA [Arthrobacter sp. HLT1-20]